MNWFYSFHKCLRLYSACYGFTFVPISDRFDLWIFTSFLVCRCLIWQSSCAVDFLFGDVNFQSFPCDGVIEKKVFCFSTLTALSMFILSLLSSRRFVRLCVCRPLVFACRVALITICVLSSFTILFSFLFNSILFHFILY